MKDMQSYKVPIIISILFHLFIFLLLFMRFPPSKPQQNNNVNVVQAVAITTSEVNAKNMPQHEPLVKKAETIPQERIRQIENLALKQNKVEKIPVSKPIPKEEQPIKPPVENKPEKESPDLALQEPEIDAKEQELAQKKRIEEQKRLEKKRKDDLKKKEQQLAKQQREEEAKQLQKELATEKENQNDNAVEDNTKNNKEEAEASLEEALQTEKKTISAASATAKSDGEIDKYKQMIIQSISRKWLMPEVDNQELACQLLVHVGPGGVVVNVDIIKESGDPNLDRSARNAIMKASPLPVPEQGELFDNFRTLRLTFRPQGIVSG